MLFFSILSVSWREKIWSSCDNKVQTKEIRKHGNILPISIRGIIWDSSNCGKTNVLINLLESPHSICFENMFSKSLQQQKYRYLKNLLVPIEEIDYFIHSLTMYYHQTRRFQIPFLSSMMWHAISKTRSESILRWVFHADVDCFYLCQTYAKHLIRDNANLLILFKQDDTNLKHVYNDYVNTDCLTRISRKNFCELCRCCCYSYCKSLVIVNISICC